MMMKDSPDPPIKVLYIAGETRSGSTLLDCLLGETGSFFSTGELFLIWRQGFMQDLLCGCGKKIRDCEFWDAVIREAFDGWGRVNPAEAEAAWLTIARLRHFPLMFFPLPWLGAEQRQGLAKLATYWGGLYRAIQKVSGCRVVVDSSKSPMGAFFLNQIPGVELYVLHLVRDSRAVVYSSQRKKIRPEVTDKEVYLLRHSSVKASVFWAANNWVAGRLHSKNPRYFRLQYERLVERPRQVLEQIGNFVGEPVSLEMFTGEHTVRVNQNHTVAGNPNRFKQGQIEITLDNEWRFKMPGLRRATVTALTWPQLLHYGYFRKS
jgi:hypothetical protein